MYATFTITAAFLGMLLVSSLTDAQTICADTKRDYTTCVVELTR